MSQVQTTTLDGPRSAQRTAPMPKASALKKKEPKAVNGALVTLIGLVVLFTGWALAVKYLSVPAYILPSPTAVWNALWSGLAVHPASPLGYYIPLWGTLKNAAIGLVIGSTLGLVLGSLMAESLSLIHI